MPRILGIDHGVARTGVAISDELDFLAHPVETVPTERAMQRLPQLIAERRATAVIVGLPLLADGSEGTAAERVRAFVKELSTFLPPDLPVSYRDESHSTVEAHAQLRAAGKKTIHHRPIIDQAAAVVILQGHLDELPSSTSGLNLALEPPETWPMDEPAFTNPKANRYRR